ncbi:unnamed protein product [Adineta steineri]|uniref:Uncharacterized protein n=1 Tax=Adineta steineri TaxID=433720 RepID=A0A814VBF8_9BILA|nr:unnamed protein product [Adineta steineri]
MAEDQNVAPSILEDNYYPFHDYYFHARNDNDEPTTDLEDADALQLEKPIKQEFSGGYCSSIKCALLGSSRKS